jgi:hypothetical protein
MSTTTWPSGEYVDLGDRAINYKIYKKKIEKKIVLNDILLHENCKI